MSCWRQRDRDPCHSANPCSAYCLLRGHCAQLLCLSGSHGYLLPEFSSKGPRFHAFQYRCLETAALLLYHFSEAVGDRVTLSSESRGNCSLRPALLRAFRLRTLVLYLLVVIFISGLLGASLYDSCCLLLASFTWAPLPPSTVGTLMPQIPAPLGSRAPTPVTTGSLHFSVQAHSISLTPEVMGMSPSLFFLHFSRKNQ